MSTLIVCSSKEHGNTAKIAAAMAEVLDCAVVAPGEVDLETLEGTDLVGFGSGIRFGRPYRELLDLVDRIPAQSGARSFVFSTSGFGWLWWHSSLKKRLAARGFDVQDQYCCKALDTMGLLGLFGGVNKGHPDDDDLAAARAFAAGVGGRDRAG
jgi:flavodoxin